MAYHGTTKNPFDHHRPSDEQLEVIVATREQFKALNAFLLTLPVCRERSMAITNLEQAAMWAIKGVVMRDDGAECEEVLRHFDTLPGLREA